MSAAPQRRLAAILAADIAGYSALMQADEAATVRDLKAHQSAVLPLIDEHGGRVIDLAGDGILAEFASAVSAVECALRLQAVMAERNANVPAARAMRFRVAVHLGECVYDEVRLYGDGVNVASRLEAIAEPGGVCVSAAVREQVAGKIDARFVDLGEKKLKNIAHAVRAFAVIEGGKTRVPSGERQASGVSKRSRLLIAGGLAAAALLIGLGAWRLMSVDPQATPPDPASSATRPLPVASTPEAPAMRRLSIVVLPFANPSNDPDQEYFADGITEDLTNDISRIAGSFVIARNTAFTYKGRTVDVRQVGRELGVRYAVEGSVRRVGDTVRVNAQFIDTTSGAHVWSERFDVPRGQLAQLEGMITGRIARALDVQLVSAEARRARPDGANADAEDLVLRGLDLLNRATTPAVLAEARRLFERAMSIDPRSADVLAYLAQTYTLEALYQWTNREAAAGVAERHARAALAIDPQHVRAHQVLGQTFDLRFQFEFSVAAFDRAIALNPSYAPAYASRARSRILSGHPEQGIADLEQAFRLSPRDAYAAVWYSHLGGALLMLDRLDEALPAFERAVESNTANNVFYPNLIAAYVRSGRMAQAHATMAQYLRLRPDATIELLRRETISDRPRYLAVREAQLEALRQAGLPVASARRLSIVVLPFANLSNDPDQEYFADGITEDLTNDISRIAGSFVIARNTAFTYKGRNVDVRQIGRDLNVRYALEGSVRRIGDTVRVNAQLIDTSSGSHVWSERFDVPRGRLAQLEGMITGRIARALDLQLVSAEARRPRSEGTASADAEDLVLRGLDLLNRVATPENLAQARRLLEQALTLDPGSADALAYLGQCHVLDGLYRFTDRQEATAIAERYARAALAIDPQHVRANQVMGQVFDIRRRFDLAVGAFDRVIALNPSYSPAYFTRGRSRLLGGQPIDAAIADLEQALALSPRDSTAGVIYSFLGTAYWMQDRLEAAVQTFEKSVEANRAAHIFYPPLIAAYAATGRMTQAQASLAEYLRLRPGATIGLLRSEINSDHPRYLALRAVQWEALRRAGLPD